MANLYGLVRVAGADVVLLLRGEEGQRLRAYYRPAAAGVWIRTRGVRSDGRFVWPQEELGLPASPVDPTAAWLESKGLPAARLERTPEWLNRLLRPAELRLSGWGVAVPAAEAGGSRGAAPLGRTRRWLPGRAGNGFTRRKIRI